MRPTEEQTRKLWLRCGLTCVKDDKSHTGETWSYGDGYQYSIPPALDLISLYKWPVPKLQNKGHLVELLAVEHKGFRATVYAECFSQCGSEGCDPYLNPISEHADNDPVLALFWAVLKVVEKEEK